MRAATTRGGQGERGEFDDFLDELLTTVADLLRWDQARSTGDIGGATFRETMEGWFALGEIDPRAGAREREQSDQHQPPHAGSGQVQRRHVVVQGSGSDDRGAALSRDHIGH